MIKLVFSINRETLMFKVENRVIYYTDRKWKEFVRCVPKDELLLKKIMLSRNRIPQILVDIFDLTEKEQEEYESCKTDEEVAKMIIIDAKSKGCMLLKQEKI